jgi:hypothetical protein
MMTLIFDNRQIVIRQTNLKHANLSLYTEFIYCFDCDKKIVILRTLKSEQCFVGKVFIVNKNKC